MSSILLEMWTNSNYWNRGKERKPLAGIEGATVDVDALWAQMTAAPLRPQPPKEPDLLKDVAMRDAAPAMTEADETDLVSVRKIYTFAGQQTTEEKQIPRSSLDQYLKDGWKSVDIAASPTKAAADGKDADAEQDDATSTTTSTVRRPLRRPSRFDSNPTGYVRALPPEHQFTWPRKPTASTIAQENAPPQEPTARSARPEKATKLNVVDKSRLDWTGFVDKEGIAEELDVHKKGKESYLDKQGFLATVGARAEEERLKMRQKVAAEKAKGL